MEEKCINKLIGKHCKIITKEPGEEKTHVVIGIIKDIDNDDGFITIESYQGVGCLNIKTIVAIKPNNNKNQ